jgi:predicted Zn-dependent protease
VEWNNQIYRLQVAGHHQQAWVLANAAIKRFPKDADIAARRAAVGRQLAADLLSADVGNDSDKALAHARAAIDYAPHDINIRLFLMRALIDDGKLDAVKEAALRASREIDDASASWIVLAYFQQHEDDRATALTSYAKARASADMNNAKRRILGAISADAGAAAGDGQAMLDALDGLPDSDENVAQRRRLGVALRDGQVDKAVVMSALPLTPPAVDCIIHRSDVWCGVTDPFTPYQRLQKLLDKVPAVDSDVPEQDVRNLLALASLVGGSSPEVQAEVAKVRAYLSAKAAHLAVIAGRPPEEIITKVQQAVADAPDDMFLRLLLIKFLLEQRRYADAQEQASEAMAIDEEDVSPLVMRAMARQQLGQRDLARADFAKALASQTLDTDGLLTVRLIAADAAMAAGEPAEAVSILQPYANGSDPAVAERLLLARLVADGELAAPKFANPSLEQHITPYGLVSTLQPAGSGGYAVAGMVYQALSEQHAKAALELAEELAHRYPKDMNYQRLWMRALAAAGQWEQAQAMAATLGEELPESEHVYLALAAGRPAEALAAFRHMDEQGKLDEKSLRSAAFIALAAGDRPVAREYFKRSIDASEDGRLPLEPQDAFNTRRAVGELEREWGGYATLSYRGAAGLPGSMMSGAMGNSAQLGTEAWWRPPALVGYGTFVDLYARTYQTLYSQTSGMAGSATMQGALGVRVKPLSSQTVILSFERLVPIGNQALSDWLARLGYSNGFGSDLRVDAPSWWTGDLFAETGRYLQSKSHYVTSQARLGRSLRVTALDVGAAKAVLWPYAVLAADYNTDFPIRRAVGAGAGVNLRYWFREDRYRAPRSYVDFSVQYRSALSGDKRARGLFVQMLFSY